MSYTDGVEISRLFSAVSLTRCYNSRQQAHRTDRWTMAVTALRAGDWIMSTTLPAVPDGLPCAETHARAGRPSFQPTAEERDIVVAMAFAGFTQERIAKAMGMSENSLRKHFSDELQCGADRMLADVVLTLANKARAGDTTACIWITKARLGWREQPKQVEVEDNSLPPEERQRLLNTVLGYIDKLARAEKLLSSHGIDFS